MNPRPLTLAIEISNPSAGSGTPGTGPGVALRDASGNVNVELLRPPAPGARGGHDDDLMPAIDRLFARRGASPRDIGLVMVSVGPGGYTSLRIACAAGKMIAEAASAKCVAVPTAMVIARRVSDKHWSRGGVAVALASKGETAWVQQASRDGGAQPGRIATVPDLRELAAANVRTLVADRFLPEPLRLAAAAHQIAIVEPIFDTAAMFELEGLPAIDPLELVPLYPREPEAVTLWRGKRTAPPP